MKKITKKAIKRIQAGSYKDLMESIEFLIDNYDEDKVNMGYRMCMDDLSVRSYKLAEHLHREFNTGDNSYLVATVNELFEVIEEYFTNALKEG